MDAILISNATAQQLNAGLPIYETDFPKRDCAVLFNAVADRVAKDKTLLAEIIPGVLSLARFYNYGVPSYDKPSALHELFSRIFPNPNTGKENLAAHITPEIIKVFTKIIVGKIDGPSGHVAMTVPVQQHMSFLFTEKYLEPLLRVRPDLAPAIIVGALGDGNIQDVEQAMSAEKVLKSILKNPQTRIETHMYADVIANFVDVLAKTPIGPATLQEFAAMGAPLDSIIEEHCRGQMARHNTGRRIFERVLSATSHLPLPR